MAWYPRRGRGASSRQLVGPTVTTICHHSDQVRGGLRSGPALLPTSWARPARTLGREKDLTRLRPSLILLAGILLIAACGSASPTPQAKTPIRLAPVSDLSPELRELPPEVQEAYRFALANPDILEKIPCYCGCNRVGHMNNLMCYVKPSDADGQPVFDSHAAG